jgi:hypothetical protein
MKKNILFASLIAGICCFQAFSSETCEKKVYTVFSPLGKLDEYYCNSGTLQEIRLGDRVLLRDQLLADEDSNGHPTAKKDKYKGSLFIYSSHSYGQPQPFICTEKLYLLDLTGKKPRVFEFGITNTCNTFHWASWGKGDSAVIAIKDNVKIKYNNGKFTFPDEENYLSGSTSATGSNKAADYVPFARELPIPATQVAK